MTDLTKAPKTMAEARAFLRAFLNENLPRDLFERIWLEQTGKPMEQVEADLKDFARDAIHLAGEQCALSPELCEVLMHAFVEMMHKRIAATQPGAA